MGQEECDDRTLAEAGQLMASPSEAASSALDALVARFPRDARLAFLQASMRVSTGQLVAAHEAFERTLQLAPNFALARYQYGFFLLTSGQVSGALEIWGPLDQLPDGDPLRHFIEGMRCLVRDDFDGVRNHFLLGISANTTNEPMNNDIRLLLTQIEALAAQKAGTVPHDPPFDLQDDPRAGLEGDSTGVPSEPPETEEMTETAFLLRRSTPPRLH